MNISRWKVEVCVSRRCAGIRRRVVAAALLVAAASITTWNATAQDAPNQAGAQSQAAPARAYPVRLRNGVDREDRALARRLGNQSPISPGPAGAHLTYYGGPVVSSVKVAVVYYGNGSYLPQLSTGLPTFYSASMNGTYMDMLSEYSTQGVSGGGTTGNEIIQQGGSNAFLGSFTITPSAANNGSTITDAQIQA